MKGITYRHYDAKQALKAAIYLLGYSKKVGLIGTMGSIGLIKPIKVYGLIGERKVRCMYNDSLDFPYAIWENRFFGGYVTWGMVASGHSWYEALSELYALKVIENQKKKNEK